MIEFNVGCFWVGNKCYQILNFAVGEGKRWTSWRITYNPLTQERLAREMGYIKPGETVYKIVQKTKAASDLD